MEGVCDRCVSLLKLQGTVAAASFAVCLYTCCKAKRLLDDAELLLDVSKRIRHKRNSIRDCVRKHDLALNKVKLPSPNLEDAVGIILACLYIPQDGGNEAYTSALIEKLLVICDGVTSSELGDEIAKQADTEAINSEQCTSALAYELAGIWGSDKVQQGDATTLISALGKIASLRYIETLVLLCSIDPVVLKAFDPMIVLSVVCLMLADREGTSTVDLRTLFEDYKINVPTALGVAIALKCSVDHTRMGRDEVTQALNAIKAAVKRRSSRIRKTAK